MATIADVSDDQIAAGLHRATALQLLVSDSGGFAFRHALTRDVVAAEMSLVHRQRFCLAAATVLGAVETLDDAEHGLTIGVCWGRPVRHQAAGAFLAAGRRTLERLVGAAEPLFARQPI